MRKKLIDPSQFYSQAKAHILEKGYQWEIEEVLKYDWNKTTAQDFFKQFVWVVLSTAISNTAAMSMYKKFFLSGMNPESIAHLQKRAAIIRGLNEHISWFTNWKAHVQKDEREAILYLESLPFIGPKTKYHLARNIGMDCAKPDRHLVRVAEHFGFKNPRLLCEEISKKSGDKVGVVDVVIWRYCNLNPKEFVNTDQTKLVE